ncbi:transcriptional regulator/sugar kinase [Sphaerochaeta pleomorpha str. Grapes]|uniref:Transcriptional regulator/sugar kinase n=1 Tax=Sphaerochaeta pleomorpha (strain ATCC BAA-1885 / DSM 22778 / Grapes) TaxID=158190 RepID=G8QWA5_SPHPG|nr:ROK family protein [Sphaerochaeta pleomorpha]AEV29403.1 transcriptional regulator/sugar kinase [Sphaerochaeta pleomorpha str. Grapes]
MNTSNDSCILALDAGGTTIKLGVVLKSGGCSELVDFQETPIQSSGSIGEIEEGYAKAIETGLSLASRHHLKLSGIAVSTPGPFDYETGISRMTHKYAAIYGQSVKKIIEQTTKDIPVRFMHDSSAFLLGEILDPRYRSFHTPAAIIIGTGLGFAIIKQGKLLLNASQGPGISIFRRPYKGKTAEDFVSKRGIMNLYTELGGSLCKTVREIDLEARKGDELCKKVFVQTGMHVGHIVAPLIQEQGIDCLILGGQIAKADRLLITPLSETLQTYSIDCFVCKAQTIDTAPLVGAAQLF